MDLVKLRKTQLLIEEIHHEFGPPPGRVRLRGGIAGVVHNPYAGHYVADITPMMEALKPLGLDMARKLVDAMGGDARSIEADGKASIIGSAGEAEHGALWHVPGGYGMREVLDGAKAIVPSATKVGPLRARIDVPIHHSNAAYVRSHFDAIEIGVAEAPRHDELVVILGMTNAGRVHERVGG